MNIKHDRINSIDDLVQKSMDELLLEVGDIIIKNRMGMKQYSHQEIIEIAKEWFRNNFIKFKVLLCGNERIIHISQSGNTSEAELAIIIADLIASNVVGVPVLTASVLLAKIGVNRLCGE
ncbi:MAG: hypothetical protein HQL57_11435 [Magnetococcales bacterium]|nr:hypothetical protein [Magnetococcales bacterium]